MSVARYRERTSMSGKKSDHGDAVTLANILRTDIDQHRRLPADTELAQSITVLARAHQDATWRRSRAGNELRSLLREYFPGFLQAFAERPGGITAPEARAVLAIAPTPARAARLSQPQIVAALRRCGRQRGLTTRAATIQQQLRLPQLRHPPWSKTPLASKPSPCWRPWTPSTTAWTGWAKRPPQPSTSTPIIRSSRRSSGWPISPAPGCSPKSATTEHDSPTPER
jgi:hypothetical protein